MDPEEAVESAIDRPAAQHRREGDLSFVGQRPGPPLIAGNPAALSVAFSAGRSADLSDAQLAITASPRFSAAVTAASVVAVGATSAACMAFI